MKKTKYFMGRIKETVRKKNKVQTDVSNVNEELKNGICGHVTTNEELDALAEKYGILNICHKVVDIIKNLYNVDLGDVSFSTRKTNHTIDVVTKPVRQKLKNVNIDVLWVDEVHSFFVLAFIWNNIICFREAGEDLYENTESFGDLYDKFFKYFFTLYFALIKDEAKCDIYKFKHVLYEYNRSEDTNILKAAVCCQYCAMYFIVAHECAHIYFERCQIKFANDDAEEFEADKFAFDIIKYILTYDENSNTCIEEERVVFPYTCYAPLNLLNFYHLYFGIKFILENDNDDLNLLKDTERRMDNLKKYVDESVFEFDISEGKIVFDSIDDTIDIFYRMLFDYCEDGRLAQIIKFLENC